MFCTNCGAQCEEGTRFCVNCGSVLENPVAQEMTEKRGKIDYKIKEKKTSSQNKGTKKNRKLAWIIAVFCCLIVVMLGGLVAVGMWSTRAELHMQAFLENMTSGRFQEAYEMLPEKERKKLSGESYQVVYQGLEITDGTITEVSKNDEEMVYKVSFVNKAGKEVAEYKYNVEMQASKKWLLFPLWEISKSDMLVEEVKLMVSGNATVTLDGMSVEAWECETETTAYDELSQKPQVYREQWITYTIPYVWATAHKLQVQEDKFVTYDEVWEPENDELLELLDTEYVPEEQWRSVYVEYIKANLEQLKNEDARIFSAMPYGFFDVDGDGTPEMFTFLADGTASWYNHVYTIRDGEVQLYDEAFTTGVADCFSGEMYITNDHRILVAMLSGSHSPARGSLTEYIFEGGKVTENYIVGHYIEDEYNDAMYFGNGLDGEEISKKKFKTKLEKYGCTFRGEQIHIEGESLVAFQDIMTLTFENYSEDDWLQIEKDIAAYELLTSADGKKVQSTAQEKEIEKEEDTASNSGDTYMDDQWCSGYKILVPEGFRYDKAEDDYCCFSYVDESGEIIYKAFHFDEEMMYGFELRYQEEYKDYYNSVIEKLAEYITKNKGKK